MALFYQLKAHIRQGQKCAKCWKGVRVMANIICLTIWILPFCLVCKFFCINWWRIKSFLVFAFANEEIQSNWNDDIQNFLQHQEWFCQKAWTSKTKSKLIFNSIIFFFLLWRWNFWISQLMIRLREYFVDA